MPSASLDVSFITKVLICLYASAATSPDSLSSSLYEFHELRLPKIHVFSSFVSFSVALALKPTERSGCNVKTNNALESVLVQFPLSVISLLIL